MSTRVDSASRRALLALARAAVVDAAGASQAPLQSHPDLPILDESRGVFVTLTRQSRLRGCIGRVEPDAPLRVLVPEMARAAALSDPRFPPLQASELAGLAIEISLLTEPEILADIDAIEVGTHGLLVSARGHRGLLLPQVAVQFDWSREEFLAEVCAKAGLHRDAWRGDDTRVLAFTAEVFSEVEWEG